MAVTIDGFIFPQPVLIANDEAASVPEIPGKEGIGIEEVYIVSYTGKDGGWFNRITFIIHIGNALDGHMAPVMPYPHGEIDTGCEIVNTGEYGSDILEIHKRDPGLAECIATCRYNIISFCFVSVGKFQSKTYCRNDSVVRLQ